LEKIRITNEINKWAINQTDKLQESLKNCNLVSRFNSDWRNNNITGYMGEAIFAEYLKKIDIFGKWQNDKFGESDDFDFLINGKKWDVKTNLRILPVEQITDTFKLCVHVDQVGLHADYYVWVLLNAREPLSADFAYIVGYLPAKKINAYKPFKTLSGENDVFAYGVPIEDAYPIEIAEKTMRGI
jgi:hypothetical protein